MHIISAEQPITFGDVPLNPFTRYVFGAGPAAQVIQTCQQNSIPFTQSNFASYERRYAGQPANGRKIAVVRSDSFGDVLITTALVHYIKTLHPSSRIDVYSESKTAELWHGVADTALVKGFPFDAAMRYDWHIMLQFMFENNAEPDQGNCFDDQLAFCGYNPADVPEEFKRPYVVEHPSDMTELHALKVPFNTGKPYILYQMTTANPNRTYPVEQAARFAEMALNADPDLLFIVVGSGKLNEDLPFMRIQNMNRVVNLYNRTKRFRSLIPLIRGALAVVCPDSSIGHLAGAFPEVPVVSLWGLFSPDDRVKYYRNHHAIFNKDVCPHSPCRSHDFHLPQAKCKDASNATHGEQLSCNVLRSITPQSILAKVREVVR